MSEGIFFGIAVLDSNGKFQKLPNNWTVNIPLGTKVNFSMSGDYVSYVKEVR